MFFRRGMVLAFRNAGAWGRFAAFHACVREMTFHAYTTYSDIATAEPPRWLAALRAWFWASLHLAIAKRATPSRSACCTRFPAHGHQRTTLKDTVLFLIDGRTKGRRPGKKLEAVVVDPGVDWPLFAEKARN